ncbi:hypothetical protein SELMODRAFT_415090 [Selaginella moellendorffii]|uniref:HotDog ACOT-type domain-containing protein n=1 Tax=Selaginella moellendorffii TaxID=88036 RepID=D8RUZ7_SELML|nr:hypothetical protein SELMODRAFT_415090 [Selaginella moellendorffii]
MALFPGSLYVSPVTVEQWKWLASRPAARDSLGLINWPAEGGGEGGDGCFTRLDSLAASQLSLPRRSVQDGRVSVHFPLATDRLLQLHYQDHMQEISMARLLKDMDCLGGHVCRKHCLGDEGTSRPLVFLTVLLDGLVIHKPLLFDVDVELIGTVQRAGRSSLHVHIQAVQHQATALEAGLVFVARDRITGKPARVNALEARRVDVDNHHDHHAAPGAWQQLVGCMLDEGRQLLAAGSKDDASAVLIQRTRHQTCFVVEPQQLNSQGSVFGGELLAEACGLAMCTAYGFAARFGHGRSRPRLKHIYHVKFLEGAKLGTSVQLEAFVMRTEPEEECSGEQRIHVQVKITAGSKELALYNAMFACESTPALPRVLPSNRDEQSALLELVKAWDARTR